MRYFFIFVFLLPLLLPYTVFGDKSVEQYLTEGSNYLINGQFNDALTSFDAAIRKEPGHYISYFKRATAYLSLGRHNAAINDFTKILQLKPDFDQILLERARVYIKEGVFQLAIDDLDAYHGKGGMDDLVRTAKTGLHSLKQAEVEQQTQHYDACISHATQVSRIAPGLARGWLLRAQCHLSKGEMDEAAGDLARVAQLNPSNPDTLLLLAKINFFVLNEPQGALTHIKQCLHYDPEQKQCKSLFREMKKLDKEMKNIESNIEQQKWTTASNHLMGTAHRQGMVESMDRHMEQLERELNISIVKRGVHTQCYHLACQISGQQGIESKIQKWCSLALGLNPDDALARLYRGELLLNQKEFEQAVADLEAADASMLEGREEQYKLRQLLHRAKQLLKQSKTVDYYKVLDVSPNADAREIKKAYRKRAHEWHPDKYTGELEKEQVVKKMAEINQAYQVLSDPDMRQQYDNGFDPFDPEQGSGGGNGGFHFQQSGGNPFFFQNGGFPGGGSHSFKMHF
ncbi:TPR-like protein [Backusella circina FSU 941]|nr:TPR-like protein [Backusella circina FSU 941]